ncbi:metallophosphoesterase [Deinococcus metallilatus]|uniref:Metallophosphoesterase family protein n=1 Tax=Deinococcus metallilatus TaxID=1211322 RepID=A0AAJ5JXN6_9DEIO|nr:metallophosphoesterase family protein [Deinococcus metallilatus]MBB5296150.1 putative phosphodiesterase [Deinococcus metallilatus]QBY09799.1 metallophosphoesterase [Deinococcus metallilatus]RXJ08869.1 metallophosphoesterase [Deinococcus metallilatus]TLK23276.1 metallophosphoesterase family protein [Deinococcus metallilatus]GMA14016.1 metallophosphoesterase [Deinococcus metallilatus]
MPSDLSIAILTDAHGNAFALEAVIQDIRHHSPDVIVNLGDQVWGQADPVGALMLQRALGAVEVRGNNDERLVTPAAELHPQLARLQAWLAEQLPRAELERIATLPTTASLVHGAVLAAHGTPATPWDSLLLSWDGSGYVRRPEHEIRERLNVAAATEVVLVGHMHREDVRSVDGCLLVSVGPVSSQGDGDPRARWALLTRRGGRWQMEARRVEYDWDAAASWEREHGPLEDAVNHACPPNLEMRDFNGRA